MNGTIVKRDLTSTSTRTYTSIYIVSFEMVHPPSERPLLKKISESFFLKGSACNHLTRIFS